MPTIDDVARAVGVSTATVSRALRGLPTVADETRLRVLVAAESLGYVSSPQASALAGGRTHNVGVVVPFVTRWYFATVVDGICDQLRERGYDMMLYNLAGDREVRRHVFETDAVAKRVDGLVLTAVQPTARELDVLRHLGRPVVLLGAREPGLGSVAVDDVRAARLAMTHLLGLGHRDIGYLGGFDRHQLAFDTPLQRRATYVATLREHGLVPDPAWVLDGAFSFAGGLEAGARLLSLPRRPTAVFAASDEMALGLLWAAHAAGVRVPEDLSVVGIDDHELAASVGLTTVAQPVADLGRVAADLLLDQVESASAPVTEELEVGLLVRATTARPRPRAATG